MQKNNIYKCSVCGNVVEVVHAGGGTLVCCGQNMVQLVPNTADASQEKHVPVVEKKDLITVMIGSAPHPMEAAHFIEWIELLSGEAIVARIYLKPGDEPKAAFPLMDGDITARAYCNLHGLWEGK